MYRQICIVNTGGSPRSRSQSKPVALIFFSSFIIFITPICVNTWFNMTSLKLLESSLASPPHPRTNPSPTFFLFCCAGKQNVLLLLSATVKIFFVSRMQIFFSLHLCLRCKAKTYLKTIFGGWKANFVKYVTPSPGICTPCQTLDRFINDVGSPRTRHHLVREDNSGKCVQKK